MEIKRILLGLISFPLLLASCGQNKPTWNKEDADLMKEHLGDNVLPYIAIEDMNVSYSNEYDCIILQSSKGSQEDVKTYYSILEKNKYEFLENYENENGTLIYSFKKIVNSNYKIDISFCYYNGFLLQASYDKYFSSWPEDVVDSLLTYWNIKDKVSLPAYKGAKEYDCYSLSLNFHFSIKCLGGTSYKEANINKYKNELLSLGYKKVDEETYDFELENNMIFEIGFQLEPNKSLEIVLLYISQSTENI